MASRVKPQTTDDRLHAMQIVVDGYKSQLAETTEDLERTRKQRDEARSAQQKMEQRADRAGAEVDQLREEIHALTIDKARLEGYIDRAREFDPQPEPIMVPLEGQRSRKSLHPGDFLESYASQKNQPQPWYKRR